MTDDAAQPRDADRSREPAPPAGAAPAPDDETSSDESTLIDEPPTEAFDTKPFAMPPPDAGQAPGAGQAAGASQAPPPPPPGSGHVPPPPPGSGQVPPHAPPPWFGSSDGPSFSREKLVRPTQGRYIAGVCGAFGRATNTDPVLWRVLLAVLGFFGGVGVLVYLIGWLAIPAEGDTASPIESLLGRGRSGMKPLSIVLLGAGAVLTFAFVVNDGFRAALLAAAVLVAAAVLLKRSNAGPAPAPHAPGTASGTPIAPGAPDPMPEPATDPWVTATMPGPAGPPPATDPAFPPPAAPPAPTPPVSSTPPAAGAPAPQFAPPQGGYRPPFAPHGPWAGSGQTTYAPPQAKPNKPVKPPREKSKLGRITFSGLIMVMGLLAVLDMAGLHVAVSAYFAAALATIAIGLIVGAWFGRARGLIALAVVATIGLGISSGLERFGGEVSNNVYRPATINAVAERYDFTVGNATLDLRRVDFANAQQETTVEMRFGQIKVLLPPQVDTTVDVRMSDGRAMIFGREWNGQDLGPQTITNQGVDGAGGGTMRLVVELNTGNLEVSR